MKKLLVLFLCFSVFTNYSLSGQTNSKGILPDTIIQNYHRADKVKATKNEALIRLKVMDFRKNALSNMAIWVHDKKSDQYWYGESDEKGEAFFLLPKNRKYTTNVDLEIDYRKFTIPNEKNFYKTFKIVYMSTRIKEVEKNDTIYQYLAQGQMPTKTRVLVNIKISDLKNKPLQKEELFYVSEKTNKVYLAVTNSQGKATLMLPKGDAYRIHSYAFRDIARKVYEARPSSRTSRFELNTISKVEFIKRENERALLLFRRDSLQRVRRQSDSTRIAEMDGYNFYLQHYYAKKDVKKIETNILKAVGRDQKAIAANANYFTENKQEIKAMLYRNKDQWKQKRIIANIDCSMYQYIDELLVWNYFEESEKNNNSYWLFNGFKNNDKKSLTDQHRRGIYEVTKNDVEGFCNTIDKIVNFSCSGSRLENVVEALIIGATDKRPEDELLFIADNYSDVSDLHKLSELNTPVRVLLTASSHGINEQYLEIAYQTGGSVHTKDEDISMAQLKALKDGERLKIGRFAYQFLKGRFLKV
ncbi:MAG: hypothetical protein ACI8YQ_004362 [Polaribacter sp.]|jgi:hypothetical protein